MAGVLTNPISVPTPASFSENEKLAMVKSPAVFGSATSLCPSSSPKLVVGKGLRREGWRTACQATLLYRSDDAEIINCREELQRLVDRDSACQSRTSRCSGGYDQAA